MRSWLTLLAAFCHVRGREIADSLTDLLITTVHRIGTKAEKRVEGELIVDLKRVAGKPALLFKLAAASLAQPDRAVRDVVFPAVGEQTLHDLVAEGMATGPVHRRHRCVPLRPKAVLRRGAPPRGAGNRTLARPFMMISCR
jgi:hypothetical protein